MHTSKIFRCLITHSSLDTILQKVYEWGIEFIFTHKVPTTLDDKYDIAMKRSNMLYKSIYVFVFM